MGIGAVMVILMDTILLRKNNAIFARQWYFTAMARDFAPYLFLDTV